MNSKKLDPCSGPLAKNILAFSIPLIFSNLLQVLFNMSDIAVVGRFAGSIPLGSVGSTTQIIFLFTGILIGLGAGINVIAAFYIGSKNSKSLSDTIHTAAFICLAAGIILLAAGTILARPILAAMNTKSELMEGAVVYLRIYMLGMPALAIYNFGNGVLSATGDTKRPLIFLTVAGIINILLNLFFVIVCNLGTAGVALASIISQYISAALILLTMTREKGAANLVIFKIRPNSHMSLKILKIGLPSGLQNAVFAFANIFIQTGVNYFDASMVAGNAAASNADPLVYDVMNAFYTACATFIGQNFGAGNRKRVLKSYFISLAYSFTIALVMGVGIFCIGRQFLSLFSTDAAVIDAGMQRLSIMSLSYCISAFMDCTIAASRGLGKTGIPSFIVIMGSCVFRIIWLCTVFAWFRTIPSLFLLYAFSWAITAAAEIAYFIHIYKKNPSVI